LSILKPLPDALRFESYSGSERAGAMPNALAVTFKAGRGCG